MSNQAVAYQRRARHESSDEMPLAELGGASKTGACSMTDMLDVSKPWDFIFITTRGGIVASKFI